MDNKNAEDLIREIAALRAEVAMLRAQLAAYPYPVPYPNNYWWLRQPYTATWSATTTGNWCVTQ